MEDGKRNVKSKRDVMLALLSIVVMVGGYFIYTNLKADTNDKQPLIEKVVRSVNEQ